jgi:MerR family transcriptional regulator, light-induced transcriptional regulator
MPTISHSPAYNLKVVLKESGLKADVLRAWERRYNFPKPQRSAGGHRLYSEYDLEAIKWLRARQEQGLSISRAVELWNESVASGVDPLAAVPPPSGLYSSVYLSRVDMRLESLRQEWFQAIQVFDSIRADELLNQAFAIYPVETVCTEILAQAISQIGDFWLLDRITVQQEHFASALACRRLEALLSATPHPMRRQSVLVGCPPFERHNFPILLISLFLARRGLKVIYLGVDVPIQHLAETTTEVKPDLVILAAQQLTSAATLRSALQSLQETGATLAFGGSIFNRIPNIRRIFPAHFLGETLAGAVDEVEHLLAAPTPNPVVDGLDRPAQESARLYRMHRPQIELALSTELQRLDWHTEYLAEANSFFGDSLFAALDLGDVAFLEADLEWVKRLLSSRQVDSESLSTYLSAYCSALAQTLGEASAPLTGWMRTYLLRESIVALK